VNRREFISLLGGTAAAWPLVADAQQPAMPVIGFISNTSPDTIAERLRAFHLGLQESGYVGGENVAILHRWTDNKTDRLPELLAELVRKRVTVIAATGSVAQAVARAITTIPIVFSVPDDPVRLGLVASLARPGNPTQGWLSGQMTEAFPWDTAPRYLLRDRDKSYGPAFRHRVRAMGITEVITAPRSPWQNPYVERLVGSIRRECLDHVIILSERHLRRVLSSYFQYHHEARTHLSLDKDCPRPRPVQLLSAGHNIVAFPEVGGLHHRYERRAA
jgi:hypothetical protein